MSKRVQILTPNGPETIHDIISGSAQYMQDQGHFVVQAKTKNAAYYRIASRVTLYENID